MEFLETTTWYVGRESPCKSGLRKLSALKVALDYIPNAGLTWIGNTNELNAGTFLGERQTQRWLGANS